MLFIIAVIPSSCPQDWLYPYSQAHGFSSHLFSSSNIRTEVGVYHRSVDGMWEEGGEKRIQNNLSMYCEGVFIWMDEHIKEIYLFTEPLSQCFESERRYTERKYNLWKYWDMLFQNEQNEWGISKNLLALFFSNQSEWLRHEQGSACIFSNESVEWIIKWLTQYSKFRKNMMFWMICFGFHNIILHFNNIKM